MRLLSLVTLSLFIAAGPSYAAASPTTYQFECQVDQQLGTTPWTTVVKKSVTVTLSDQQVTHASIDLPEVVLAGHPVELDAQISILNLDDFHTFHIVQFTDIPALQLRMSEISSATETGVNGTLKMTRNLFLLKGNQYAVSCWVK